MSEDDDEVGPGRYGEKILLWVCVVYSGAAIMVYEFIAVRVLQRFFGSRLDVWSSEIGVCLGGLAAGYYVGGKLADRYRSLRIMGGGMVAGAVLGAFIVSLGEAAGEWLLDVDAGLMWHPLFAALVSSFLPLVALGTVLPQAIRLSVPSMAEVGSVAGRMSAISTVGSIVGVLATGMFLLPNVGVLESLYSTSAVLLVLGIVLLVRGRGRTLVVVFVVLCIGGRSEAQVIFEQYSAYHHILVEDSGGIRILRFDNDQESLMSLNDPYAGGFEYADFFHVPMVLDPTITRVLFVGLGGGTGPKSYLYHYPQVSVDVAEIDPMVIKVAKEYFFLPSDKRLRITMADGRSFLRRSRAKYGAIMMDAYSSNRNGGYLPYHLATVEFFAIAWDRLENGGCLFYNVITNFGNGTVLRDLNATLESVFQVVYAFQAKTSLNTVLIAQKIDPTTLAENGTRDGKGWPDDPWMVHPLSAKGWRQLTVDLMNEGRITLVGLDQRITQFARVPRRGRILTDNYAPVDVAPRRR